MKNITKLILPITYVVLLYLTMSFLILSKGSMYYGLTGLLTIILGIANIITAFIYTKRNDKESLLLIGTVLKSSTISAYIIIFLLITGITALLTVFIGFFSLITTIPVILADIFMLIVSSSFMIGYLILDFKDNKKTSNIIHAILQFIFVLDVIDMLYINLFKEKKHRLLSLIIIILAIIIPYILLRKYI